MDPIGWHSPLAQCPQALEWEVELGVGQWRVLLKEWGLSSLVSSWCCQEEALGAGLCVGLPL